MDKRYYLRAAIKKAYEALSNWSGPVSLSVSAGGGTKSVSFMRPGDILSYIKELENELAALDSATGDGFGVNYARWC